MPLTHDLNLERKIASLSETHAVSASTAAASASTSSSLSSGSEVSFRPIDIKDFIS